MEFTLDPTTWAQEQFGECNLGDRRRTKRAVTFAAQVAANPSGSTPHQTPSWSDCKAAYRLFDQDDVTFARLAEPHWRQTRQRATGHSLLLGDTTEIEFGIHRKVTGLGPTGNGGGRGFFLHSSMLVAAESAAIDGLAGQEIFHRKSKPKGESRAARSKRKRESEVWGRVIDQVGAPPEGQRWTHVLDRGADNFEVYCHALQNRADFLVRVQHLHRWITTPEGERMKLSAHLKTLPVAGTYELDLRGTAKHDARVARVEVRFGTVTLPQPILRSPWLRKCGLTSITVQVIEVREIDAPKGVIPLRWVLYTSHAVGTFKNAYEIVGWYEKRWLIEEFHKALKTGCRIEERQYMTSKRLESLTGMLSVVAVRLLQLKAYARAEPDRPAKEVVPTNWIVALRKLRPKLPKPCTVKDFYRHLAGLGGFLGRKSDGEPGWITLWRGFERVAFAVRLLDTD